MTYSQQLPSNATEGALVRQPRTLISLYTRRRLVNVFNLGMSLLTTAFGLFWLIWLLWTLLSAGLPALNWAVFTQSTPPPGSAGGLANAIVGSVLMTGLGILIGAPAGVLAGTYLSEFGRNGKTAATVRFVNGILLSAPSIIIGVFVYELVVMRTGHFSAWAGALALALIVLPVVVRTTEDMLRLVPDSLREAAAALGAPQWKVVTYVAYRAARAGIMTGILLALARISGETAPLLFTALNNQFWSSSLQQPIANLPVVIFQFAMSPYEDWHHLAWAGALLITASILVLNILVRFLLHGRPATH
jgi:phosphate transport system permease protein